MTIEDLNNYGADTADGLKRCVDNVDLYLRLVKMIAADDKFAKLKEAIGENDLEKAFEAAHGLKGAAGNLSLTPLYEPLYEITELLRTRTETDYTELMRKIEENHRELQRICAEDNM